MTRNFRMSFIVLSTNFDLEPVLADYVRIYPENDLADYQIVFKTEDEHQKGSKSYIMVYDFSQSKNNKNASWGKFLESYCILHNLVAVIGVANHIFPDISGKYGRGTMYGKFEASE